MGTRTILVLLGLMAMSSAIKAQTFDLRPGRYEVTSEMEMNTPFKLPPQNDILCITAEDLKDLFKALSDPKEGVDCKVLNQKVSGRTVMFEQVCESNGVRTTGTTEITAAGESYTKVTTAKTNDSVMTFRSNGKRVGECTK